MAKEELTKIGVMTYLSDLGFDRVIYNFSGGGDSGDIEPAVLLREGEEEDDIDSKELEKRRNSTASDHLDWLQTIADDVLNNIEDWWNNEGGGGKMTMHVPTGKYEIDNYIYIQETESFSHEGELDEE